MKTAGYIVSIFSIYCLALAALLGRGADGFETYLILGSVLSGLGMFMRWLSYQMGD